MLSSTPSSYGYMGRFGSNQYVSGASDFLKSNSSIAKVIFVIIVLIIFMFLLRLGVSFVKWLYSDPVNPILIRGIKDGQTYTLVNQDPSSGNSKLVSRSKNRQNGIEFTWSTWLFIKNIRNNGKYQHIFHKGVSQIQTTGDKPGMNYPINGPGLYIDRTDEVNQSTANKINNNLVIAMNTNTPESSSDTNILEIATVKNVPLNKWINVVIRMKGRNMDVYINGTIVLRHTFRGVPKQNYGNVYSSLNGGFDGLLSDLRYFGYALNIQEIMRLNSNGPNMEANNSLNVFPPYFSLKWYTSQ
jgi:hypothetical protein